MWNIVESPSHTVSTPTSVRNMNRVLPGSLTIRGWTGFGMRLRYLDNLIILGGHHLVDRLVDNLSFIGHHRPILHTRITIVKIFLL